MNKLVLDIGSLDINGNNQYLFEDCQYTGIDVGVGKNVDIVSKAHELKMPSGTYDTIISTECFEHFDEPGACKVALTFGGEILVNACVDIADGGGEPIRPAVTAPAQEFWDAARR